MNTIDSENIAKPALEAAKPKGKRKPAKKAKPAKQAGRAKKAPAKPKAGRTNKKAEVIAMMKRAKGATLAETMSATKWQAHTVRGRLPILLWMVHGALGRYSRTCGRPSKIRSCCVTLSTAISGTTKHVTKGAGPSKPH